MVSLKASLLVVATAMSSVVLMASASEAAVCRSRMDGIGKGQGIAGAGTELAKSRAATEWSTKVQRRHGARFANFSAAQDVRYDCRSGAVLEAKCVVSAKPCRS